MRLILRLGQRLRRAGSCVKGRDLNVRTGSLVLLNPSVERRSPLDLVSFERTTDFPTADALFAVQERQTQELRGQRLGGAVLAGTIVARVPVVQVVTERRPREPSGRTLTRTPRIAVLSDHELYRDGIVEILRRHGFRRVEGFPSSGNLLKAGPVAPLDLTLVDLAHEKENSEEVVRRLRAVWPDVTLVAIGTPLQLAARAQDVDGCFQLPTDGATRLQAMAETVARRHHGPIKFSVSREVARQRLIWASLTPRQRQVLGLLGCGVENSKIAASLGISERAIKGHVGCLLEKFGAHNRTELALIACRSGVAPDGAL